MKVTSAQSLNDSLVASNIQASKSSVLTALEAALDSGGKGFYSDDEEEDKAKDKKSEGDNLADIADGKNETEAAEGDDNDSKKTIRRRKRRRRRVKTMTTKMRKSRAKMKKTIRLPFNCVVSKTKITEGCWQHPSPSLRVQMQG